MNYCLKLSIIIIIITNLFSKVCCSRKDPRACSTRENILTCINTAVSKKMSLRTKQFT